MRGLRSWSALWMVALVACSSGGNAGGLDAGALDAGGTSSAAALATSSVTPTSAPSGPRSAPSTDYDEETSTRPLEVLKFQFTSAVKGREPVDALKTTSPGDRVYAYLTLRNRSGRARQVHVEFTVNGETRTVKDLDVAESWSYRTWVYNTVSKRDKPGKLALSVTDDEGHPLVDQSIPIAPLGK